MSELASSGSFLRGGPSKNWTYSSIGMYVLIGNICSFSLLVPMTFYETTPRPPQSGLVVTLRAVPSVPDAERVAQLLTLALIAIVAVEREHVLREAQPLGAESGPLSEGASRSLL